MTLSRQRTTSTLQLYCSAATSSGTRRFASRQAAEAVYDDAWRQRLTERFGAPPTVEYFESPVTVDPEQIVVS